MRYIFGLLILAGLSGCQSADRPFSPAHRIGKNSGAKESYPSQAVSQVLQEANVSFTYKGKPIHPCLVKEFEPWISDLNPVTLAVDVSSAFDSNEYSSVPYIDGEWIRVKTDDGIYGYKRISSENGVHILQTSDWAGGSQAFGSELWVKFEIWQSRGSDGMEYDQLVMSLISMFEK